MSKDSHIAVITTDPVPARAEVTELASENRPQNGNPVAEPAPPAPPVRPAPTPPVDHLHLHRRFERLLVVLEQQGILVEDNLYNVRTSP
jgi:hypothetical protein